MDTTEVAKKIDDEIKRIKLSDVIVEIRKMPSYLSCFFENDSSKDICLIYKKEKIKLDESIQDLIKNTSISIDADEVDGKPLEVPEDEFELLELDEFSENMLNLYASLKLEKDNHCPISAFSAREIHNFSNVVLKSGVPLWTLVDKTDLNKSLLLGSFSNDKTVITSYITAKGLNIGDTALDVNDLLKSHKLLLPSDDCEVDTEVNCKIEAVKNENAHGHLYIYAKWNKLSYNIPANEKSLKLEINVEVGKESSPLNSLWQQLLLLKKYYEIVVKWKSSYSLPQDRINTKLPTSNGLFDQSKKNSKLSLSERIIDAVMSPQSWYADYKKSQSTYEEVLYNVKTCSVSGMDVTGKLWVLLSECATYEELSDNFKLFFQQSKKCFNSKPFVNLQNKSKVAEFLRLVLSGTAVGNPLVIFEPLELLVELGIEYLKHCYMAIFVQSEIAKEHLLNEPNLQSFTSMDNSAWIDSIATYINWMSRVHSVAELVQTVQADLKFTPSLPDIIQSIFLEYIGKKSPVKSLNQLIEKPSVKFIIPIKGFHAPTAEDSESNVFLKHKTWFMKLTSKINHLTISSSFLRTQNFIFPRSVELDALDHLSQTNLELTVNLNILNYGSFLYKLVSITRSFASN